jgi:hypothetical protein
VIEAPRCSAKATLCSISSTIAGSLAKDRIVAVNGEKDSDVETAMMHVIAP